MTSLSGLMRCEACHAEVYYGSDYVTHLTMVHHVKKGHARYLARAKNRHEREANKKIIEIVIDSDSEEEDDLKELDDLRKIVYEKVTNIYKKASEYLERESGFKDIKVCKEEIKACETKELRTTFDNIRGLVKSAHRNPMKPSPPKPEPGQTLFLCPLPDCTFFSSKEGMMAGLAARHLSQEHQIKARDMKPGVFRFTKLKGEKLKSGG